ncbi:hypothetical protein OTB20_08570 [Streptomyces sp. H27-H1]|uniref:hypothetical protein n=1 Tax=Streptomyces sp. H27-H1 TaxID=2996461 RepID=UPI002271454B|nr:hypothetical protein [Streptomyces sp. H27-H1]MCY0926259.1 hypothetical protein [Streptomyces sp. H27-H1]
MSYIDVYTYDGDAEEYREDEPDSLGDREPGHRNFREGEELDAAQFVIGLLSDGTHFDVRHTRF